MYTWDVWEFTRFGGVTGDPLRYTWGCGNPGRPVWNLGVKDAPETDGRKRFRTENEVSESARAQGME